jgi:hypothetical protein
MKGKIHAFVMASLCMVQALAQDETDALRYSQGFFGGTARFESMAGAFGALGADISVMNTNPAGLARFTENQFTLGINNAFLRSKSTYNGTKASDKGSAFGFSNIGILAAIDRTNKGKGWHGIQFGFSYNRTNDYQNRQYYEGQNFNSLLEIFASEGYGVDPSQIYSYMPFTTALAWDTYALDWDANNQMYIPRLTMGDMYHKRTITTKGGVSDYNLSFSANYVGKWYFGGTIGLQNVRYFNSYSHEESLLDTVGVSLRSFTYSYSQSTKGFGVNLKLGAIYLPMDNLRIGLAFHTPTVLSLKEYWTSTMSAVHSTVSYNIPGDNQPQGSYYYKVSSPMRIIGSVAYVAFSRLALDLDLEFTSYNWSKLKSTHNPSMPSYDFKTENATIHSIYKSVVNLRLGAEFAITSQFFVRGGFAYYPSPYKRNVSGVSGDTYFITTGVGYKWNKFYIDLSYKLQKGKRNYYAFNPADPKNLTQFNDSKNNFMLTLGFRF